VANGWTGGQYSLYRAVLALTLATHSGVVGAAAALPLALGLADRWLAGLWLVWIFAGAFAGHFAWLPAGLLALHLLTPAAPYGSWAARGRPDPDAGWRLPRAILLGARALLALALLRRFFPWFRSAPIDLLPLSLLSFDPAWLPPLRDADPARLFYDGACGVCHAAVRFVLAEDRTGHGFRFAALGSDAFARLVPAEQRAALPDSIVLVLPDGALLVRSDAILEIGERLGGVWLLLARAGRWVPAGLRDGLYDAFARQRKRLVRAPDEACPLLNPELRARFD
jgi:predicted DCC family thiol-disulfide oxidoreductase YuxK